jgi:hypothetical protein
LVGRDASVSLEDAEADVGASRVEDFKLKPVLELFEVEQERNNMSKKIVQGASGLKKKPAARCNIIPSHDMGAFMHLGPPITFVCVG